MMKIKAIPLALAAGWVLSAGAAQAGGDAAKGMKVFTRCLICHTIKAGDPNRVGPNLHGLFERQAGKAPGFNGYSEGIKAADFTWDDAKLNDYLANPQKFSKGARMAFRVPDEQERQDVIAYLHEATK
ncbi:MAG: c-type cytochrome [Alphaproteobacteria bacterium]